MGNNAPTEASVTIYHNPNCSTSRFALAAAAEKGVEHRVVLYLDAPPDRATLEQLVARLQGPVEDLVRKDANFKALGLTPADYVDDPTSTTRRRRPDVDDPTSTTRRRRPGGGGQPSD